MHFAYLDSVIFSSDFSWRYHHLVGKYSIILFIRFIPKDW